METRRDYEIAGTLGRAFEQHRRLDFDEFMRVHVSVDRLHYAMAQLERLGHLRPAEVEVSILQPQRFVRIDLVHDLERRRFGLGDDLHLVSHHLHLAGGHLGVLGSCGSAGNLASDADDIFVSDEGLGLRSDHDLDGAPAIPHVEEGDAAVVATARDPAVQLDPVSFVRGSQRTAVRSRVTAHET